MRAARSHLVHLVGGQVSVSGAAVLGLQARVASLRHLVGSAGGGGRVNLVQAESSVLAALGFDSIDGGGQAVQDVGDAVAEAAYDTADNALKNGLDVLGGAGKDVFSTSKDVFDVTTDISRLEVEEFSQWLKQTTTEQVVVTDLRRGGCGNGRASQGQGDKITYANHFEYG